ncbi:MAG: zinc-ribbon domain-containing protein [Chloroflexi bacterium]|nr:zinc-ribbon domain-containing protein [Chloroflexota bacterium]MBT4072267.1 zinc-ribbon domain-containing protein [Chloroflexota bacterium]MBT4513927.1 zinc-ribbon domain-containing protein [Chloroflexota bacterium]MBT5318273.1 zinc-ribbon domain-containing protein [Chloroflexota bacterium]MBT6680589.1 zinc-ribbon domain-containing protein [Chloroflexota bacterium]
MSNPSPQLCGQCGAQLVPNARFCGECGAELLYDHGDSSATTSYSEYDPASYSPSAHSTDGTPFPGEQAGMGTRTGAWLITNIAVQIVANIPVIGWVISLGAFVWNLVLYKRGQDIGARLTGIRVVRDTGELAGFYHMWTRGLASIISFLAIGAGFWTAYSDPNGQTWHDKWMGTYVVKASPEIDQLPGTSSDTAKTWFWVSIVIGAILIIAIFFLVSAGVIELTDLQ